VKKNKKVVYPLSRAAEERVVERSDDRVSQRSAKERIANHVNPANQGSNYRIDLNYATI